MTTTVDAFALTVGLAVGLAMGAAALVVPPRTHPSPAAAGGRLRPAAGAMVAGATLGLAARLPLPTALAVLVLGAAAIAVARLGRAVARRRQAAATSAAVIEVCDLLRDEVAAGQPPLAALRRVVDVWPPMASVVEAGSLGLDVAEALRARAVTPGAESLRLVAGAWVVSHRAGRGLADALDLVSSSLRAAQATRRVVDGELASARATARLLAVLPVGALVLGGGLLGGEAQASPWHFLLASPAGVACLMVGLTLEIAGLWWTEALARDVLREV